MTSRIAIVMVALLSASLGCRKPPATSAIPGAGPGTPAATPSASTPTDYRTLNQGAIEVLITQATGGPITLKPAGTNKYTGTRPSPDGTLQIPVTVTVEANRIVIESRGGGLMSRDVIDAAGKLHSDLR